MMPRVDPKVDYAFRKVFGSRANVKLLLALVNAVLKFPPGQELAALEILNPFEEPETWDGRGAILDIKARDQQGRLYNVEMQMVAAAIFLERVLYYWALVHGKQLDKGDEYDALRPTISISFVNGVLFPEVSDYHLDFQLRNRQHPDLVFSNLHAFHVIELPKFRLQAEELVDPLDAWCYFLRNGETLDTDHLPESLRKTEVPQAMEVLQMLTQDEKEWFVYQDRLKFERDQSHRLKEAERGAYSKGQADATVAALIHQIRFCQGLLHQKVTDADELQKMSIENLSALAASLEQQLAKGQS